MAGGKFRYSGGPRSYNNPIATSVRGPGSVPSPASLPPLPRSPTGSPPVAPVPRLGLNDAASDMGPTLPLCFGQRGGRGEIIWMSEVTGTAPELFVDIAVAFGEAGDADTGGGLDWLYVRANGRLIWAEGDWWHFAGGGGFAMYDGTETQTRDPTIAAAEGAERTPAFRGLTYAVFTDFPLEEFDGQVPAFAAHIMGSMIEGVGSNDGANVINLVELVAERLGLDPDADLDIDPAMNWGTSGAMLTEDGSFGEFLATIGRFYGFDFFEADAIKLVRRLSGSSYTVDFAVTEDNLLDLGDAGIHTTRLEDTSPLQLTVSYIDVLRRYEVNTRSARRILWPIRGSHSDRRENFSVPLVAYPLNPSRHVANALYREAEGRVMHSFRVGTDFLFAEPCDVATITSGNTTYDAIVDEVEIGPDFAVAIRAQNLQTDADDGALVGDE